MSNQPVSTGIPEVDEYYFAKRKLEMFKAQHQALFTEYAAYVEEYNQKRQAAEKVVRAKNISCGDFDLYQEVTKIDAKALHDAVGREVFISVGGALKFGYDYKVDPKRLQLAVAQGRISQDLVNEITKKEPRYHMPLEYTVP